MTGELPGSVAEEGEPSGRWLAPGETEGAGGGSWDLLFSVFGDPAMAGIFSEQASVSSWLAVERALAAAEARCGLISEEEATAIAEAAQLDSIDFAELWRGTRNVGYPILPLVRMVSARLAQGPDGRVHYGATTQDIMDTALALQLMAAIDRLADLLSRFGECLVQLVQRHAGTVMAARTHAQQAVPTTFGAKLAVVLAECSRHRARVAYLRRTVPVVSLYGAGGTSASFSGVAAQLRLSMAEQLGLGVDQVPWHVARDRLAEAGTVFAMLAATAGRFAREVIELSSTEVGEVAEISGHHRGASSTMPQKHNPISSEVVVGMATVAGSLASGLLATMRPSHERAAGEWQAEWALLPLLARTAAGALANAAEIASGLRVLPEKMAANLLVDDGLLLAEAYMMRLAPAIGRERAHDVVYEAAERIRSDGTRLPEAIARILSEAGTAVGAELVAELAPEDYLGDVAEMCESAVAAWKSQGGGNGPYRPEPAEG
jgi:3-carboxy-cis,cis-muconate cycloisomerase